MRRHTAKDFSRRLARVALDGARTEDAVRARVMKAFTPLVPAVIECAVSLAAAIEAGTLSDAEAVAFVRADARIARVLKHPPRFRTLDPQPRADASPRLAVDGLPELPTHAALASWLRLDDGALAWFADAWRDAPRDPRLSHYTYRWKPREYGPDRLIEIPKPQLRAMQRRIDAAILRHVPLHDAAYGFVRGRSVLEHAKRHEGRALVLRIDLEQFFVGIGAARVAGVFRLIGYPDDVSRTLAALCTNRVPLDVLMHSPHGALPWIDRQRHRMPHLPQGAPTSPALANLVAWSLDARLAAFAARRGVVYGRYADDLTFSGDVSRADAGALIIAIARIAEDSGFRVNHRKTRVFTRSAAQRVTGLVVNRHANVDRAAFDRLKATLTNCVRHGPASQDRDACGDFRARLTGLVAWHRSVNPVRGAKLERLFARIDWRA